jgi:putative FmdB family regulatory protein
MSPNYEYRCNKCMSFTVLSRKVEERDEEVTCICGHTSGRIYNTPAIRFNGSGFYSTGG